MPPVGCPPAPPGSTAPTAIRDVSYAAGKSLDLYLPRHASDCAVPAVVFVHGGGWSVGDKSWYAGEAQTVTASGWAGVTIDYGLLPSHPYPAAVNDTFAAVRWLHRAAARFGIDPSRIAIFGGSAGGNLAALVAMDRWRGVDPHGWPLVRAAVSWSGLLDLPALNNDPLGGLVTGYLGCAYSTCPARWARASPVSFASARSAPMLLVNGSSEVVPQSQVDHLARRLRANGVRCDVLIVQTSAHDRGYFDSAWDESMQFLHQFLDLPPDTVLGSAGIAH
jgi:acetyl esterase